MANKPNIALRDFRALDRKIVECQVGWPADLVKSALIARNVLYSLANNPPHVIEALMQFKALNPDLPPDYVSAWDVMMQQLADFSKRYAEWKADRAGAQSQETA